MTPRFCLPARLRKATEQVHVIKLLTRDGVVKTVRITVRDKKPKKH